MLYSPSSLLRLQRERADRSAAAVLEGDRELFRGGIDFDEAICVGVGLEAVGPSPAASTMLQLVVAKR
jgi:hypothetical protein